jgi:arabinogalactan endo-1,4-beta-galactosidase
MIKNRIIPIFLVLLSYASVANAQGRRMRKITAPGQPIEIQLTPYKTTMIGDGKDTALMTVK